MMQKIVERTNFSVSPLMSAPTMSSSSSSILSPMISTAVESSSVGEGGGMIDSSSESSTASSPLSPSAVEEEMMIRAATSGGGGNVGMVVGGSGGVGGGMMLSGRSGSPFPFPAIMSVSPDPKSPAQFLLGLGIQILEGRLPDHKQAKGFLEGDHCTSLFKSVSHFCDFESNPLCRQLASLQFLLMSDPSNLSLDVVLTPSKHAAAVVAAANNSNNTNEYNTTVSSTDGDGGSPESSLGGNFVQQNEMLIEKWRVSLVPQEENEAGTGGSGCESSVKPCGTGGASPRMTPRNLHNAVRSFLHFSQLAAWLSKKKEFTSTWKVRIDMADNGTNSIGAVKEGWDRHEFPAVTLESQAFWDSVHSNIHYSHQKNRGWSKGPRSNTKWILKVTVDSLPRMENFPLLPVPTTLNASTTAANSSMGTISSTPISTNTHSITTTNTTKPCLSSSASRNHNNVQQTNNKSQQVIYTGMLGENEGGGGGEENSSGVRIRFRGGRSRRSHASGGNNGSSSHRSRPKNLRIAIPDVSQSSEEDADVTSYSDGGGIGNGAAITTTNSAAALIENMTVMTMTKETILLGSSIHNHHGLQVNVNKIPTLREKLQFESSLNRATSQVFHKSGLPLTSSPAPIRRFGLANANAAAVVTAGRFDFDSSLIAKCSRGRAMGCPHFHGQRLSEPSQSLLGSFEESVLNGRIEPVSTVEGFTAEVDVGSSHNFKLPVTVFFYTFCDNDRVSSPYSAHVTLSPTVYPVPRRGTLQVTLYNPMKTVVKMFVINYDLSSMPANSQTFIRQKILFMPLGKSDRDPNARKWLRYLIHLRFASSASGDKIYLHKDIRMIVLQKSDADTAVGLSSVIGPSCHDKVQGDDLSATPYELRSFTYFADAPSHQAVCKL